MIAKMINILFSHGAAIAEATAQEGAADVPMAGSLIGMLLPIVLMVGVFYFLLIRPQKKKDKKVKDMLANLKVSDRVCTIGGIYGTIVSIKDDTFTIAVGQDGVKLVVARWAIRNVEEITIENDGELLA